MLADGSRIEMSSSLLSVVIGASKGTSAVPFGRLPSRLSGRLTDWLSGESADSLAEKPARRSSSPSKLPSNSSNEIGADTVTNESWLSLSLLPVLSDMLRPSSHSLISSTRSAAGGLSLGLRG